MNNEEEKKTVSVEMNEAKERTETVANGAVCCDPDATNDAEGIRSMPCESNPVEGAETAPFFAFHVSKGKKSLSFSDRMGDAGYMAGRRYDAVKNAFLSYKTAERKPKTVRTRITNSGETFYAGRKVLGKLCLVGGYLRLFLALDPTRYNSDKYHHKDYSEVVRYAKFPFMIKLSSDRQVKYAEELIEELLTQNGFVRDADYVVKDQASIFKKTRTKKKSESQTVFVPPVVAEEELVATDDADVGEPESIDVKLPNRATVVDKQGGRIGRIRKRVWKDEEDREQGVLVKEETNVFVYSGETRTGYVDKNDNILTLSDKYVATIRRPERFWFLALVLFLALATIVTAILSVFFLTRTENTNYAPVIFLASEDGTSWSDTENLPVFANDTFGDSKIAPGMSGCYRFTFENQNKNALVYSLTFSEENEYSISILYRLKRDGAYICGAEGYVDAEELSIDDLTIEAKSSSVFELEWYWEHNDEADTAAGENGAIYTLAISLLAQVGERA